MKLKRRPNGKGCAVHLNGNRVRPWGARITIGWDKEGKPIRHFLGFFENELDALLCLQSYHNSPYTIYISKKKHSKIDFFSPGIGKIVPATNPKNIITSKVMKANYTFSQVYKIFEKEKFPSPKEAQLEKEKNIKAKGKLTSRYAATFKNVYDLASNIHDKVYQELTASDFQAVINFIAEKGYTEASQSQLIRLFKHLDVFAIRDGVIQNGFAQYLSVATSKKKRAIKSVLSPEEIKAWFKLDCNTRAEEMVRDIFIFALHTGCRIREILFLQNKNIFLDMHYVKTGSKTEAGIDREIPIHSILKPIIEKYYTPQNEFLFTLTKNVLSYSHFTKTANKLMREHAELGKHTIHECRHTFRTEMERMNVKHAVINAIIGHKNNDVGLDVYTHISLMEKLIAVNKLSYKTNIFSIKTS